MKYLVLVLATLFCLAGCEGCKEDITPSGELCERNHDCGFGNVICDDGDCKCFPGHPMIAPGFCVQDTSGAVFITYDQIPRLIDTTVVRFAVEPFDQVWQPGDDRIRFLGGETYNRTPYVITAGRSTWVGDLIWPGDFTTPVDSIRIARIFPASGARYVYSLDGWRCTHRFFEGKFVDRNTIKGFIRVSSCENTGDQPMPEILRNHAEGSFPVTYHRVVPQ